MKIRVPFIPWPFPAWVVAVTVWPCIFHEPGALDDPCVEVHERYHLLDQARWLVLPWFVVYGVIGLYMVVARKPADWHPLEREAYRLQRACEVASV